MKVLDAIRQRHSYRGKYKEIPVPKDDLRKIMQAGLDAPSGCNKQTTSLIAVDDPGILTKFYELMEMPASKAAPAAVCVLPVGIAQDNPSGPVKKAFEERTWFNSFAGNQ